MASIRAMTLVAVAAALLAIPAYFALAQPGEPKPAPADAPKPQPMPQPKPQPMPGDDRSGQPQPGPGGEGRARRGPDGQPGGTTGGRGAEGYGLPQSVNQSMKIMNRALRTLKDQGADVAKKDANLKLVSDMQRGCLAAKGLVPERALGRVDPAKRDELAKTYRKQLIAMMEKLLKLESAILDGKGADAAKLADEAEALSDESHKMLGVQE